MVREKTHHAYSAFLHFVAALLEGYDIQAYFVAGSHSFYDFTGKWHSLFKGYVVHVVLHKDKYCAQQCVLVRF